MHGSRVVVWSVLVVACLALQGASPVSGQEGFVRVEPENLKWNNVEGGLGAQQAILEGDPAKPGLAWTKLSDLSLTRSPNPNGVTKRYEVSFRSGGPTAWCTINELKKIEINRADE